MATEAYLFMHMVKETYLFMHMAKETYSFMHMAKETYLFMTTVTDSIVELHMQLSHYQYVAYIHGVCNAAYQPLPPRPTPRERNPRWPSP